MGVVDVGTIESFGFMNDSIVIRKYIAGLQGGVVLDVTGFNEEYIKAGHAVIYNKVENVHKPLGVAGGNYVAIPEGSVLVGVVTATKATAEPFVGVMYSGEVNDVASPYPVTAELAQAFKETVPTLVFKHD